MVIVIIIMTINNNHHYLQSFRDTPESGRIKAVIKEKMAFETMCILFIFNLIS